MISRTSCVIAGLVVALALIASPALADAGLTGYYFNTTDLNNLATTRVDSTVNFTTWGSAPTGTAVTADNEYSERWEGYVEVEQDGNWTFYTQSNDGVRLWVDDTLIIENWDQHASQEDSYVVNLTTGWYPITLEHFQSGGSVVIQLSFEGPGQSKAIIPSTNLSTDANTAATYALTVTSGTGDGDYEEDDVVAISADTPSAGQIFDEWDGNSECVADSYSADTNVTMPAAAITVAATYQDDPNTFNLNVVSGTGDGFYESSAVVAISADAPGAGQVFDYWDGNSECLADINSADTNVTMPAANITVTATYANIYALTVTNGTGDGNYEASEVVNIYADAPGQDQTFDGWSGDTQYVADANEANTTVTMPASAVAVTATYLTDSNLPSPWINADIGSPPIAGSVDHDDGNWTIEASGTIYFQADAFHFVYRPINGDVEIVANVASVVSTDNPWAAGGVMIRQDLTAGCKSAFMAVSDTSQGGLVYDYRTVTDGTTSETMVAGAEPEWVKLVREGGTITGYHSNDGSSWTQVAAIAFNMDANVYVGLAVAENDDSNTCITTLNNVSVTSSAPQYTLTVTNGTGDGDYEEDAVVNVYADAPATGKEFDVWTDDTTNVANVNDANTTITMPAAAAAITATYVDIDYTLTVNSGTGDGTFNYNDVANIYADAPGAGQAFDVWTGDTTGIANVNDANTTITMPAANAAVTATYVNVDYVLTVNSGTGDGNYNYNDVVNIVADAPGTGQAFDAWTGDTTGIDNVNAADTNITMPAANAAVTATYVNVNYVLTVNSGTGDGNYNYNDVVNIVADSPGEGQEFDVWTGDTTGIDNVNAADTNITMPAADANITATYANIDYTLTVNSGTGDGDYEANTVVNVYADAPATGKEFNVWTGDTTNVANVNDANTTITMPASAAAITATYSDVIYRLDVNSGTGDGNYIYNQAVNIYADAPGAGQEFDAWTGDTTNVANVNDANTTITMPASAATVTATYANIYTLTVVNGTGDGNYRQNDVVAISAADPNTGQVFDYWDGNTECVADVDSEDTNVTMPAAAITVTAVYEDANTGEAGLTGYYFNTTDLNNLATTRVDSTIDFTTWGSAPTGTAVTADNEYSERWEGYVEVEEDGNWTFYTQSNDGVRLWVDDVLIIENWNQHGSTEDTYTVNLTTGWYPIKLEHFQSGGSVVIQLSFEGPGQSKAIIPSTNLSTEEGDSNTPATYTLTVTSGTGDGDYEENNVVAISADTPPAGQLFDEWDGNSEFVADVDSADTNVTMPAADITVTATYQDDPNTFNLNVVSGTGDGYYASSAVVAISAGTPSAGQLFDQWDGNTECIADVNSADTNVTMPAADITVTATYEDDPNYVAADRGYTARACGFDFDHDGILGEDPDDMPWKNTTASTSMDIDGDSTNEDIIYVDSYDGDDSSGDGSPNNPYETIQKAFDEADGPGDGAEDIICIYGTFHEAVTLTQSGVSGYYTRDNFQFPTNPFMLIGWDKDGDGEFPPYDQDDEAVIDGSYDFDVAINGDSQSGITAKSYLEFAHLKIRQYGKNDTSIRGAIHLRGSGSVTSYQTHLYVHDIEFYGINRNMPQQNDSIMFRMWRGAGGYRPALRYLAVINCDVDEMGGYFVRGSGIEDPNDYPDHLDQYLRFQNLSLKYYGYYGGCTAIVAQTGWPYDKAGVTGWKMWCNVNEVEILDNVIDGNPTGWFNGNAAPTTGLIADAAVQHWRIVNNEFIDLSTPVYVQVPVGCEGGTCVAGFNPIDDILIDRNFIHSEYDDYFWWNGYWQPLASAAIKINDGEVDQGRTWSVEDVTITNNMVWYDYESHGMVWLGDGYGGDGLPPQGTITVAGNTFYTDNIIAGWSPEEYAGVSIQYVDDVDSVYVIKNNIFVGLDSSDRNIHVKHSLTNFTCNGNVYDANGVWVWNDTTYNTLSSWQSATGEDANSSTGTPIFVNAATGDLHLDPNDTVAEGAGVDISGITDHDYDGDTRDGNTVTAGADVPN